MREIKSGVYQILNVINGKRYIGSSKDILSRWRKHKQELQKRIHHSIHLQRAWNRYGEKSFVFEILESVLQGILSKSEFRIPLLAREQYYKDLYKSYNRRHGYDICPLAKSRLGSVGLAGSKNPMYGKIGDKHFGYGKVRTQEIKQKISK